MFRQFPLVFLGLLLPATGQAQDPIACPGTGVFAISDDTELSEKICTTAEIAVRDMKQCGLRLDQPVIISVLPKIEESCFGVFHCADQRIDVLSPSAMGQMTETHLGIWSGLPPETLFASVVTHELVHAAYANSPCPFDHCPATSEYLAYAMQIASLRPEDRAHILAASSVEAEIIHRDEINFLYALLAPDRFAVKAFRHLYQKPDACAFISSIAAGEYWFDTERLN